MTTFAPANPLDFARADFGTFTVPHPVRAAVVDSLIKENRANTPLSAINERKSPRITVSELNDMDMDEIKQRFYNTGIDTRGPVTKFLDIIDLPRNALFNLAAGDTARRKANMGDNAAFGLARVNTSDVLESLGVRPGLASGILGFVGDVALDPLTYVGPAGWGAKAASKAGRTVSYTRQGTKVLREAVDAVKAGRTASSPAVAKYLETLGHTAESIAAHPDKAKLASDVERTLLGGKQTRFNKVMSAFGEDAEKAAVENTRTIADDIADYANFKNDIVAKDAATNARVAAAKDVYKEIGRPFSKGVRFYKDATKPMGIGMTTSRDMAHGSGIIHVPFTDIQVSVPSFTPFAAQQGLVASLTKNGVGNFDENKIVNGIKPVVEELDNRWHNYQQEREAYDSIIQSTAAGVDDVVQTPEAAHREFLDYAYGPIDSAGTRTGGAVSQMAKTLEDMQADPMTSYADMLHAQDVFKAYAARAQIAREEYQRAKEVVTETGEFAAAVDEDVTTIVSKDIEGLRKTQRDENMRRAAVKEKIPTVINEIDNEYAQHVQARRDANPAIKSDVDEAFGGYNKRTTGISKAQLSKNSDPAFYDTATQEWKDLRYTPPGEERNNLSRLAVGDSQTVDVTESMYPDGVVPDDVERVYDTVQRQDSEILNDFVSKENQAFTGLQVGLKESGRFSGNVAKIDLAKVQPNDVWFMGDTQVKVVGVNPIDGTVDLEVLMPPENVDVTTTVTRPSEKTRGKKTKTTRQRTPTSVESQERPRYYTVSSDQTPFASKASKKSEKVTVERLDDMGELDLFEPEPTLNRETAQSMALERLGVTPDDLTDARLGQGTEYDGLDEMSIKERLVAKRLDEQRAKMNAREDGAVPMFSDKLDASPKINASDIGLTSKEDFVSRSAEHAEFEKLVIIPLVQGGSLSDTDADALRTIFATSNLWFATSTSGKYPLQSLSVPTISIEDVSFLSQEYKDIVQEAMSVGRGKIRGSYNGNNSLIRIANDATTKDKNSLLTLLHEIGHHAYPFDADFDAMVKSGDVHNYLVSVMPKRAELVGDTWKTDPQEAFADLFAYVSSTKRLPTGKLGAIVEKLTEILQKIVESASRVVGIDPKVKKRLESIVDLAGGWKKSHKNMTRSQLDLYRSTGELPMVGEASRSMPNAVPLYLNKAERTDRSAYADYLHAKANAAQSIADASMTPYLATIGSDNKAAVEAVRDAWGLGADDLGSGIMQSVVSATNKYSPNNKYGQKAINEAQALERFFVNRMGLPPGIANDMVKQAVKSANVADTVAFKTAVADITRTLTESGISPAELTEANDLAMALLFAGDEPIEALIARGDIAGEMIQKALTSGILQDPNKAKAIRSVVDKYRAIFAKLDDGTGIANYAPNVLTPQAKNIIDYQRRNRMGIIGARKRGEDIAVSPVEKMTESFEKKRSTIEHEWMGPDNKPIRMMESELAYLAYSPQDLQKIADKNPAYYDYLDGRIKHAKLYSQLTEADKLTKVKSYYLSPMEINRRVRDNGMFNTLTNNALNGNDFMHSNFTAAVAARLGSQERKYANELLQQYLAPHALRLNEIELAQAGEAAGKAVDMKTVQGTPVTLVNEGGKKTIYLGNKKYKQPDIDISSDFSPLKSIFTTPSGKPIANEFYPEEIADIIDDTAGFFSDKATGGMAKAFGEADAASRMTAILKGADTLSGYWKVLTLLHPSWTINDIIGNLFFMANMGINPATAVKNAKEAFKMVRANAAGDRDVLREMAVKGRSAADHFDDALGQVVGSHQAADATMHLRQSGETIEPFNTSIGSMLNKTVRGDFAGAKAEGRQMVSESWQAAGKTIDNQNVDRPFATQAGKAVKQPINALFQQGLIRRVWQPWAHLNGMANDWLKVTAYLSMLDDGYDATSAARLISEKMLDMSVLTSTDRSARRFVPFYNWMKNSGVLGAREFLRNPKFFSIAPKVKHALEESFNGEQNLPENARPSWIRDQLALQIGTDMDTRRALTLTSSLPTEAATYGLSFLFSPFMGTGALQDSLAYGINSLTPAVKIPLELGSRREFFTKRTIDAQGGDITPGEYLTQQVRPFRELGIGSLRGGPLQRAFSDSPVMGISRALVGGRLQPFDEERRVQNLQREYDDRVDALRRRIGIAERETQKEESLRRRIELLQLFNQMQKLSLTIPKWATGQIAGLSTEPTAN